MRFRPAVLSSFLAVGFLVTPTAGRSESDPAVFGAFAGSSPAGGGIRELLKIPEDAAADLIQWNLTLFQDPQTLTPTRYRLTCDYGPAVSGLPGLGKQRSTVERNGSWRIRKGIRSNPKAVVYELNGTLTLYSLDPNILHMLNPDRSLMIGNGGWSYTLYRREAMEKPGDPSLTVDMSPGYEIQPVPTGPAVFGVFEGRSPCLGIARELKIGVNAGCIKVKWRVALYQDPRTQAPTRYRIEDSLHRRVPREGTWTITHGTATDPHAVVYELAPVDAEAAVFLMKADDNVLFHLDQSRKPLVGHAEFSYTINRRQPAQAEK